MATLLRYWKSSLNNHVLGKSQSLFARGLPAIIQSRRLLQTLRRNSAKDFAFAFDIDGVLIRSSRALPRAKQALSLLQENRIPFILLTNGGGKHESERVAELSKRLEIPLDTGLFVQSHTPFAELVHGGNGQEALKDKCILVTGGDGDKCRKVAEKYGFTNVITPGDIITAEPQIWPFSQNFASYYESHAQPLPKSLYSHLLRDHTQTLKVDAIFIFNDPRDWALDTQLILDLLLSHRGYLGTRSPLNGKSDLPNRGYQQDGQPPLYFSNPDLLWASAYHEPRLGQGGFREAFEGVWRAITGGEEKSVILHKQMCGKPYAITYAFAEKKLELHRQQILKSTEKTQKLKNVYMVGDNPESDIRGANQYSSLQGSEWQSILVRTGVYSGGEPAWKPNVCVEDVWDAVQWGLKSSGWPDSSERRVS